MSRAFTENVAARLQYYAGRGAFHTFARVGNSTRSVGRARWNVVWHMNQRIEIVADGRNQTLALKGFLATVDRESRLDQNLRAFITAQTGNSIPQHRRLADRRSDVRVYNRQGVVSVTLRSDRTTNAEAMTDRVILLGHQVYTVFLREGGYDDYLTDALGVDLDAHM